MLVLVFPGWGDGDGGEMIVGQYLGSSWVALGCSCTDID